MLSGSCVIGAPLRAQTPSPSVSLSFGVDTSIVDVRDIVRLTRAYWRGPTDMANRLGEVTGDASYGDLLK